MVIGDQDPDLIRHGRHRSVRGSRGYENQRRDGIGSLSCPKLLDTFTHAQQAKTVLVPGSGEVGGVESDTVVLNLRLDGVLVPRQAEPDVARFGMAQDICQRLLEYPEQDGLGLRRKSV